MTILAQDRSYYWPPSFEQTAEGNLFIFNGIDDGLRIKRYAATPTLAGIFPPDEELTMAISGTGEIDGDYYAYYRYIDADGIPSSLSPISDLVTADHKGQVDYSNIGVSDNPRVAEVQGFRNTAGQTDVFYLDFTVANGTTTATSTKTDEQLTDTTDTDYLALPILNANGSINANRFVPPPYHKAVCVQHQDRLWFAVDVAYTQGNIHRNASDATKFDGLGTAWTDNFVGRFLNLPRDGGVYEILEVDEDLQTIKVDGSFVADAFYGYYAILPHADERNKIYFSFPGEQESVPPVPNSFKIQEIGGDEVVGLMPLGQFLFVLMRRHVYRIAFGLSPNDDLSVTKTVCRGAINQRCWIRVEDVAYLMDREGVHRFEGGHDGGNTEHISEPIQDYFRDGKINWAAERFFFTSHNPTEEVIRFHVCIGGNYLPKQALCYHYRHSAWWVEEYPYAFGGTCLPYVNGFQRCLLGSEYGKHYFQNESTVDNVRAIGGSDVYRAYVDSATLCSITDADAVWPQNGLINAPICIVDGPGKGQVNRIVSAANGRIGVLKPWRVLPQSNSVYQIGAIPWNMTSGTYRFVQEHQADVFQHYNRRRIRVVCQPTDDDAHLDLQLFYNHDNEPFSDFETYSMNDGVATLKDESRVAIDTKREPAAPRTGAFSGYAHLDISKQLVDPRLSDNWLTVELSGYQGRDPVILYTLGVDGAQ